jgi:hypothetical protein
MRKSVGVLIILALGVCSAAAQDCVALLAHAKGNMCGYAGLLQTAKGTPKGTEPRRLAVNNLINLQNQPSHFLRYAYTQVLFDTVVSTWDQSRVDKQLGATSSSIGTTNLVSRPSTPELLGIAVEYGALTQTSNGSVTTFRANADSAIRAIAGQPISCIGCVGTYGLKNLNFAASFDMSRQGTNQVSTAGPATPATPPVSSLVLPSSSAQFSSFSARYDIYNPKDTRSPQFQNAWKTWYNNHQAELETAGEDLLNAVNKFLDPVLLDPNFQKLQAKYRPLFNQANQDNSMDALLDEYLSQVVDLARSDIPNFGQQLLSVRAAYAKYSQVYSDLFQELRGKPQFSFEYTFNRPVNQPDTDNFRLIYASNPFSGGGLLSANLAMTLYQGQIPAGAHYGRFRDVQAAAQFDRPLPNMMSYPAVFTLAGYVQYQVDPSIINIQPGLLAPGTSITLPQNAQVLLGTKGTTAIAQGKITLKMGNSGVRIPIALTWASRTELINATDVRGNIGITYDLDSLLHQ